ncbi:hypothetical protein [Mesorhizobium sp. L2C066B000]|uniref:hypothetical protein n=1 Tax=Mesorhizobium sp. L2C066B000 TaxID=1287105 RepID=UPI0003D044E8|nr:hypothetical protein [Mesorhizobium sp. L2C066B000]ESZ42956.1 hypothetical protein X732_03410 [Mesorhizobium sp. L2C066B000]
MPSPTKPVLDYSYTSYQQEQQGVSNFPGTNLDADLAELVRSADETIDALADVRRSDGKLKNQVVTPDALSPATLALLPAPPSGTALQLGSADGVQSRVTFDRFGTLGNFTFRRANGTPAARTALGIGDPIGGFSAFGAYDGTNYTLTSRANVLFSTTEAWTPTAQGASVSATPNGTTASVVVDTATGEGLLLARGFSRGVPVTKTADFAVAATDNWLINNKAAATCTVTLPAAATFPGREITVKNLQAFTVVSAAPNVVPMAGGAATAAILAATAGEWATLVSDGSNWMIMAGN